MKDPGSLILPWWTLQRGSGKIPGKHWV